MDRPAVTAHDPEHRRQPEAPARELGGEERLEDLGLGLLRNPIPAIDDLDLDPHIREPVRTRIAPPSSGIASAAFVIRFITTWRSWVASPSRLGSPGAT